MGVGTSAGCGSGCGVCKGGKRFECVCVCEYCAYLCLEMGENLGVSGKELGVYRDGRKCACGCGCGYHAAVEQARQGHYRYIRCRRV